MAAPGGSYVGSKLLENLAKSNNVALDRVNYLVCMLAALVLAVAFRRYCSPETVGTRGRHVIVIVLGLALSWFCFGHHALHLIAQCVIGYAALLYLPRRHMPVGVLAVSMLHLAAAHMWRQYSDYGGYTLDITGPLMISTQKISSLAFSIGDGQRMATGDDSVKREHRQRAIGKVPSVLEFFSYILFFPAVLAGPFCFYSDFKAFMDGSLGARDHGGRTLSPKRAVVTKLGAWLLMVVILLTVVPKFPVSTNADEEFISSVWFPWRLAYLCAACTFARCGYYVAWLLGDATNNAAGLGYNGVDEKSGRQKWDRITNVDIIGLETAPSFKVFLDNWNIQTTKWLRHVCYERVHVQQTFLTFLLSSVWHGFYPGYYGCFISAAILTIVARKARRVFRPSFQRSAGLARFYDGLTLIAQVLMTPYTTTPHLLMSAQATWAMYRSMYFFGHVIMVLGLIFLPSRPSTRAAVQQQAKESQNNNKETAENIELQEINHRNSLQQHEESMQHHGKVS